MIRGIYHSAAGMLPRYHRLINISNNLANASTTAFKADRRYFSTVLNNEIVQPGKGGMPERKGELNKGLKTEFRQGELYSTGVDTEFALSGDGFFVVENPEDLERGYTRDGRFKLNSNHELVTAQGWRVLDDSGAPIIVRDRPFFVDEEGHIFQRGNSSSSMMVATFEDLTNLIKKGDSMFGLKKEATPETPEDTSVQQGHLESSNVNVVEEMVFMIELNRTFESSQRALTAQDQTLNQLINKVSKF
ncbi:flagellar hook-basal body protein [bacterium]|nr:flagellar hook-basal body protein [bacterium]